MTTNRTSPIEAVSPRERRGDDGTARLVTARRAQLCARCGEPIAVGARVVPRQDGLVHPACDALLSTAQAAERLELTPTQFRWLVEKRGVEPDGTRPNPHYKSAPRVKLWSPTKVSRLGRTREAKDAKARRNGPGRRDWLAVMQERYESPAAAIPDAARALFNLNRYARHTSCSRAHRQEVLDLKSAFVTMLYKAERYTDRVVEVRRHLPEKVCVRCDGLGCDRCEDTGVYQEAREVRSYVFTFTIGSDRYTWVEPDFAIDFTPRVEESRVDSGPTRQLETALDLPARKFAEAKALVRYAIAGAVEERPVRSGTHAKEER